MGRVFIGELNDARALQVRLLGPSFMGCEHPSDLSTRGVIHTYIPTGVWCYHHQ